MTIPLTRVAALVAVVLPTLALSQSPGLSSRDLRALAASLPQGAEFQSDGLAYRPVAGLRAASRAERDERAQLRSAGASSGLVVEEMGPYVIYRDTAAVSETGKSLVATPRVTKGSVVVNVRTGQLGIADGNITAELPDVEVAKALAAAHGLTVTLEAAHIGYAFFAAPPGRDLAAAAAALAKDPRVKRAYANVREGFAGPG